MPPKKWPAPHPHWVAVQAGALSPARSLEPRTATPSSRTSNEPLRGQISRLSWLIGPFPHSQQLFPHSTPAHSHNRINCSHKRLKPLPTIAAIVPTLGGSPFLRKGRFLLSQRRCGRCTLMLKMTIFWRSNGRLEAYAVRSRPSVQFWTYTSL